MKYNDYPLNSEMFEKLRAAYKTVQVNEVAVLEEGKTSASAFLKNWQAKTLSPEENEGLNKLQELLQTAENYLVSLAHAGLVKHPDAYMQAIEADLKTVGELLSNPQSIKSEVCRFLYSYNYKDFCYNQIRIIELLSGFIGKDVLNLNDIKRMVQNQLKILDVPICLI